MTRPRLSSILLYALPLGCNVGMGAYLAYRVLRWPGFAPEFGAGDFFLFYGVGALVIMLSAVAAFLQLGKGESARPGALALASLNATMPTLILLLLFLLR